MQSTIKPSTTPPTIFQLALYKNITDICNNIINNNITNDVINSRRTNIQNIINKLPNDQQKIIESKKELIIMFYVLNYHLITN